tara:strand:+ start:125 stop:1414 length:1290 start_codon:yes stop_codon:yes gene_type:complete
VVNTLRRKMFSMGGNVPGHHGVGITSGMRYNKGGRVGFAPGGGVDPVDAMFEKSKADATAKEVKSGKGLSKKGFGLAGLKVRGIPIGKLLGAVGFGPGFGATLRSLRSGSTKPISGYIKRGVPMKDVRSMRDLLNSRALRTAGVTTGGVLGAGGAASLLSNILPDSDLSESDAPILRGLQMARDYVVDPLVDYTPGGLAYYGFSGENLSDRARQLAGKEARADIDATPDIDPPAVESLVERISAEDQLRQDFAQRKALYEELMSSSDEGQNNLGVLGRSLLEASEALNQGQGYVSAGNVFGTGIADEVARRDERTSSIRDAAATQAITDVMSEQAVDQATMNEMIMAGDVEGVRIKKGLDQAQAAGIPLEKVPTDDGGELDKESLNERTGTVFIDPDNVVGKGFFVAVNSRGEKASFNDVQAAIEFAET